MDYGQNPGVAEPFYIDLEGGRLTFVNRSASWRLKIEGSKYDWTIPESNHKTIRDLKAHALKIIKRESSNEI